MFVLIKSHPHQEKISKVNDVVNNVSTITLLKVLLTNHSFWIVTLFAGLLLGTLFNFGANWLIGFQNAFDNNNLAHSALVNSLMFLGVAVGNPIIGALSLYLKSRRKLLIIGSLTGCIVLAILILGPQLSQTTATILYFVFGFSCSTAILSYSVIMEILPNELQGIGIGICNTIVYLIGALLSVVIGYIIHFKAVNMTYFSSNLYLEKSSLSLFCLSLVCAFILSLFINETFVKSKTMS